jgi:hypothetical protein
VCTLLGEKLGAEAQCLLEPRYMKTLLVRKAAAQFLHAMGFSGWTELVLG